jgi:hypothetical protein
MMSISMNRLVTYKIFLYFVYISILCFSESQTSITSFEDVPNEVMYEVFEFLDFSHVYECFSNLNNRFCDLLNYFPLPINLTISPLSNVHYSYTNIIIPHQDQIIYLCLSNQLIFDLFSSLLDRVSPMIRLETLILENIESKYLPNLLANLVSLPHLFALVIIPIDNVENKNNIYREIFRLPVLKYCKVAFNECYSPQPLPMANNNELSPVIHLIINGCVFMSEFNTLLSYVPQLRRLSCDNLSELIDYPMPLKTFALNNLTHVSLKMKHIRFDQVKSMIQRLFSYIHVFRISTDYDPAYSDINQWKQIIIPSMPNLRILDIEILPKFELNRSPYDFSNYQLLHNYGFNRSLSHFSSYQFISLFLFEQQWCFACEYRRSDRFSKQRNRYRAKNVCFT